jgi:hypothetical protein
MQQSNALNNAEDCLETSTWCYSIDNTKLIADRYMQLSIMDVFYFENPHRRQCIALQYTKVLDSVILCQSLGCTIAAFPTVGSRVEFLDGIGYFHLNSEQVKIRLVVVSPQVLSNKYEWCHAFDVLSKHARESQPLFQAFLLRCADESHGCVLMAVSARPY